MSASSHASALYRERSEFSQIQRLTSLCLLEFSGFYILFNLQFSRFLVAVVLSGNFDIISRLQAFVNNFFHLFSSFLKLDFDDNSFGKRAEKEGFEPSRRFPDLHP